MSSSLDSPSHHLLDTVDSTSAHGLTLSTTRLALGGWGVGGCYSLTGEAKGGAGFEHEMKSTAGTELLKQDHFYSKKTSCEPESASFHLRRLDHARQEHVQT